MNFLTECELCDHCREKLKQKRDRSRCQKCNKTGGSICPQCNESALCDNCIEKYGEQVDRTSLYDIVYELKCKCGEGIQTEVYVGSSWRD